MEIIIQPLLARDLVPIKKEELTHSVLTTQLTNSYMIL